MTRRRAWWSACFCAALAAQAHVARADEAEVVEASARLLLVRTPSGEEVVGLERAATLLGVSALSDLGRGDRIRYTPTRRSAGVLLAGAVEVPPVVTTDATLSIPITELSAHADPFAAMNGTSAQIVVDVRERGAYARGHLPGAVFGGPRLREAMRALGPDRERQVVFIGDGPRDRRPVDAAREAIGAGYRNVRVFLGGLREWESASPVTVVDAADLRGFGPGEATVLDVRPRAEAEQGGIPGALRVAAAEMAWQDYVAQPWFPALVVAGRDGSDRTPLEIAEKIWRWQPQTPKRTPLAVRVLRGGLAGWVAAGGRASRAAPPAGPPRCAAGPERACPGELEALFAQGAKLEKKVVLDVRPALYSDPDWVRHIPLEQLPQRMAELPREKEVVIFCFAGRMSRIAQALLARNGFKARYVAAVLPQVD